MFEEGLIAKKSLAVADDLPIAVRVEKNYSQIFFRVTSILQSSESEKVKGT